MCNKMYLKLTIVTTFKFTQFSGIKNIHILLQQ